MDVFTKTPDINGVSLMLKALKSDSFIRNHILSTHVHRATIQTPECAMGISRKLKAPIEMIYAVTASLPSCRSDLPR